ncbi:MAG: hypothetical protein K6F92_03750 [Lachnospiraceae bacterium]|nr:hypothetical protein [Lachnospiraceae bacterium]
MRKKNIYYVACALSLALMGCNSSDTASESAENAVAEATTTVSDETEVETTAELVTEESAAFVGMVSAISGNVVTLTAGEVEVVEGNMGQEDSEVGQFFMVPDSDSSSELSIMGGEGDMPQMGEAPQMGQMPGGDMSGNQMPGGQMPGGQMQFPGGDMQMELPEGETFAEGEMPGGELPEGETFAEDGMQFGGGMRGGDMQNMGPGNMEDGQGFGMEMDFSDYVPFTASGEDATEYDLGGVTIVDEEGNEVALEDIAEGDVLTITVNDDGTYTVVWNGHGFDMSSFGQI